MPDLPQQTDSISIHYCLRFVTPFHIGTGLRRGLVHRAIALDAAGYAYIPGSTLKGTLRAQVAWLADAFGLPTRDPHNTKGQLDEMFDTSSLTTLLFGSRRFPGSLFFDDVKLTKESRALFDDKKGKPRYLGLQTQPRTQVSLSRVTRTARQGALFTSEYGLPDLEFEGEIRGTSPRIPMFNVPEYSYATMLLVAGLSSLERIGGNKSSGAGQVQVIIDTPISKTSPETDANNIDTKPLGLRLNGKTQSVAEMLAVFNLDDGKAEYDLKYEEATSAKAEAATGANA